MDHHYFVYGVALSSDMPFDFPADVPSAQPAARVRFARAGEDDFAAAHDSEPPSDAWFACREIADRSVYLRWSGLFEFLVAGDGTCVKYRPLRDSDPAILQNFLFGQTLSFALIRQNVEPVHAAVVDLGGHAIALLGDCTYGKSTLAAALLRAGCRLVSDDVLVVRDAEGCLMARAGSGRIKLLPDSAAAVLGDSSVGVRLLPGAEKRVYRLDERMVQRSDVRLRAFVVLPTPDERNGCDRIAIGRIPGAEVFHELVRNTFVRYLGDGRRLHQNFSWNAHLASAVDGYQLRYPPGIDRLSSVADTLIGCFRRQSRREPQ